MRAIFTERYRKIEEENPIIKKTIIRVLSLSCALGIVLSFILLYFFIYYTGYFNKKMFLPFSIITLSSIIFGNIVSFHVFARMFNHIKKIIYELSKENPSWESVEQEYMESDLNSLYISIKNLHQTVTTQSKLAAIGQLANQVAHDIRSPISAILMLAKEASELSEEPRVTLRNAANRIQDIANNLLNQTDIIRNNSDTSNDMSLFLISAAIMSAISEKKIQYKNKDVKIDYKITPDVIFIFIEASLSEFKRVLSNLLNNAVEAIELSGSIMVELSCKFELIQVRITDSGNGMPQEICNKILSGETFSKKFGGKGLGYNHARQFLKSIDGQLNILSQINQGTQVDLIFHKKSAPSWIVTDINLYDDTVIVILDDDSSIHGAWNNLFSELLKKYPRIEIIHFVNAGDCITYLKEMDGYILEKVLLLTDYELIRQDLNGLDVIEFNCLKNPILVTNHYEDKNIQKRAVLLNTKILPKLLVSEVKFNLLIRNDDEVKSSVKLVVLEDNKELSSILAYICESKGKAVDIYHEPAELLEKIDQYDKLHTKIYLDNDLGGAITGIEVAENLYKQGFINLYITSGYNVDMNDVPKYINIINSKMEIINL